MRIERLLFPGRVRLVALIALSLAVISCGGGGGGGGGGGPQTRVVRFEADSYDLIHSASVTIWWEVSNPRSEPEACRLIERVLKVDSGPVENIHPVACTGDRVFGPYHDTSITSVIFTVLARKIGSAGESQDPIVRYATGEPLEVYFYQDSFEPGEIVWAKTLPIGFDARALAVDETGNTVVVGGWSNDGLVIKFDDAGDEIWRRSIATSSYDVASGVVIGKQGQIVVSGHTWGNLYFPSDPDQDYTTGFIRVLDTDGYEVWTGQINGPTWYVWSNDIQPAIDEDGYVTSVFYAVSSDTSASHHFIYHWYPTGGVAWTGDFYALSHLLGVSAVAVDSERNILVGGSGVQDGEGHSDFVVTKFSSDGDEVWVRYFGSASEDYFGGLDATTPGRIGFSGTTYGDTYIGASQGGADVVAGVLDANGFPIWIRQFGTAYSDWAGDVALDSNGAVLVVGDTLGGIGDPLGGTDGFVRKYDEQGDEVWTRQIGSASDESASSVGTDQLTRDVMVLMIDWTAGINTLSRLAR